MQRRSFISMALSGSMVMAAYLAILEGPEFSQRAYATLRLEYGNYCSAAPHADRARHMLGPRTEA